MVSLMDDILVYGTNESELDGRLEKMMKRIEEVGLTLNRKKCVQGARGDFLASSSQREGHSAGPGKSYYIS